MFTRMIYWFLSDVGQWLLPQKINELLQSLFCLLINSPQNPHNTRQKNGALLLLRLIRRINNQRGRSTETDLLIKSVLQMKQDIKYIKQQGEEMQEDLFAIHKRILDLQEDSLPGSVDSLVNTMETLSDLDDEGVKTPLPLGAAAPVAPLIEQRRPRTNTLTHLIFGM